MALLQQHGFTIPVVGDGVSTVVAIDLYDYIAALSILPKTPSTVAIVQTQLPGATVSGILNGTTVTVTYSIPVPNLAGDTLTIVLGF
jgi:hypothetical protein